MHQTIVQRWDSVKFEALRYVVPSFILRRRTPRTATRSSAYRQGQGAHQSRRRRWVLVHKHMNANLMVVCRPRNDNERLGSCLGSEESEHGHCHSRRQPSGADPRDLKALQVLPKPTPELVTKIEDILGNKPEAPVRILNHTYYSFVELLPQMSDVARLGETRFGLDPLGRT